MKKIVSLIILALLAFNLNAQNQNISINVKNEIAVLDKADLKLSDVQMRRITAVLINEETLKENAIKEQLGDKTELESKLIILHKNKINNLKGAMTPEQVQKFNELKFEKLI